MSTLYEITGEYLELLEMLEEADELEMRVVQDTLEGIGGELEVKADNYAKIIRELDAEATKYEEEKKRLEARGSALRNRSEFLKKSLFTAMKATGKTKFKTDLFQFGIQKNGGKAPLSISGDVPAEFCKLEPDNDKIREALAAGTELPFAQLLERGEHLRIR